MKRILKWNKPPEFVGETRTYEIVEVENYSEIDDPGKVVETGAEVVTQEDIDFFLSSLDAESRYMFRDYIHT